MAFFKSALFALLWAATVCYSSPIEAPLAAAPADYLLENVIEPVSYDVALKVPANFGTVKTFDGGVKITFKPVEKITTGVKLHANKLTIDPLTLKLTVDGTPTENLIQTEVVPDAEVQMVKFPLVAGKSLDVGKTYTLEITYKGILHEDMYGFYISSYTDINKQKQYIATTQFQPTHARRAFPCFDEPKYKATFKISITHPKEFNAISNTPGVTGKPTPETNPMVTTTFEKTPKMSTYLVAFVISTYASISVSSHISGSNAVWTRQDVIDSGKYGFDIAPKLLKAMEDMTKIPYSESTIGKLDQVAIPDFSAGAMENWGLVTYRETALLWDAAESTTRQKQRVGTVVAHELSHMWFGNLITLKSWDYTWINEGFARFFEYRACDKVETEWELSNQFVVEQHQSVLNSDSILTSQALTSPAYTPGEISSKFGSITYSKGGSVIRMMENFMGSDNFFKGIADYLKDHKFGNTEPADLWTALAKYFTKESATPELKDIMEGWTTKSGFPVVTVSVTGKNAKLTQKRFLFSGEETTKTLWTIPISYTTSADKAFVDTKPKTWLTAETGEVANAIPDANTWFICNIQASAFIRVNYDDNLWDRLQTALRKENSDGIHVLNRAQLVDDAMNLARAGHVTYKRAFDVVQYLEKEKEYYPWYPAFSAFSYLRRRFDSETELAKLLDAHISRLMKQLYASVPFEGKLGKQVDVHKKVLAQNWACKLKNTECVKKSVELFTEYKEKNIPVDPDLRSIVYCTAIGQAKDRKFFDFLWDKYGKAKSAAERGLIIPALACSNDNALLTELLGKSIAADSGIRKQDALSVFNSVVSQTPLGPAIGLAFFKANLPAIKEYGSLNALTSVIQTLADRLTKQTQVTEFTAFLDAENNAPHLGDATEAVASAKKTCENNMLWVNSYSAPILKYLKDNAPVTPDTTIAPETKPPGTGGTTSLPNTTVDPNSATSLGVGTAILIFSVLAVINAW